MFRLVGRNDLGLGEVIDKFINDRWEEINRGSRDGVFPLTDICERDGEVVISLEIPGVSKEDIKIHVEDRVLTIEGEKKEPEKVEGLCKYRQERKFGHFARSFSLSEDISLEDVGAEFLDGILNIRLKRIEPPKPEKKIIPIS